jgi:pimeloyl-ACP methyl ester carboxylesterase
MNTVKSKDGTSIAFDKSGQGPAIILVAAALSFRSDIKKLADLLSVNFTVYNYDRRGRGDSTDTQPHAVQREVEDIEALIDEAGGSASLFGSSSGAVLALEAASKLGKKVRKLFLYEPPFIVDGSFPPMPGDFSEQIGALVSAGRRSDAVKHFFHKGMGIPSVFVTLMRLLMPGWNKMTGIAHTLQYDLAVVAGTQTGKPLPADRWAALKAPALVTVGSKSETFFHTGAQALAALIDTAEYRSLEGQDHGSAVMAPKVIAVVITEFLKA